MKQVLKLAIRSFYEFFGYMPSYPPTIDFDQEAYATELDQCVADQYDYTIEKYGTIVTTPRDPKEPYID